MRGVAYSPDALYTSREHSRDFSPAPVSASGAGPALPDGALDPMILAPQNEVQKYFPQTNGVNGHVLQHNGGDAFPPQPIASTSYQWYAPGPQGDPFAPQPYPIPYPALGAPAAPAEQALTTQRPGKRKRRQRREEECSYCGGDDAKNKEAAPERMLICTECGRKGHPSCMELRDIGENLYNNPWRCVECKICEICRETGDDARILFCDNCDRGWHMDCLDPPLEAPPEGTWCCPQCASAQNAAAPGEQRESQSLRDSQQVEEALEMQIDPALQISAEPEVDPALMEREPSAAASSVVVETRQSSRSPQKGRQSVRDRKGKGRAVVDSEEEDADSEAVANGPTYDEALPSASTTTTRSRPNRGRQAAARARQVAQDEERPSPPPRSHKKLKVTMPAAAPKHSQSASNRSSKMFVRLRLPSNAKGKGKARAEEEEEDEPKKGMFDDVLASEERDVAKTTVAAGDKERFEKARSLSEAKLIPARQVEPVDLFSASSSTGRFPLRSTVHQLQQQAQALLTPLPPDPSPSPSTPGGVAYPFSAARADPNALRIRTIRFGPYDIQTWYDAPFPEEFSNIPEGRLWICEFCLKYMKSRFGAQRHMLKCKCRHPPGDEIYRDGVVSIFEVDGRRNKIYCQNLCLLSKMFLDHKSLFYDVEPFLFYVITEVDDIGARFVGYFSKEKTSTKDLNLSCIMTLPVRQRQGWGNMLIDFSYLLSRKEHKVGTPERPLSALGAIGYRKYWTLALMRYLQNAPSNPRLEDISQATGMNLEDIYLTLVQLDFITVRDGPQSPVRPSPGRSIRINRSRKSAVARRNLHKVQPAEDDKGGSTKPPFVPPELYEIVWEREAVARFMEEWTAKGYLTLKPEKLKWIPFMVSRAERTQALQLDGAALSVNVDVDVGALPRSATEEESGVMPDTAVTASAASAVASAPASAADAESVPPVTPEREKRENATGEEATAELVENTTEEVAGDDAADAVTDETATETGPGTAEANETSATDSPSPLPMFNALEALAAVASAVSKANTVEAIHRSFSSETSASRNGDLWGHKSAYSESFKPIVDAKHRSLRPPVQVVSRQSSEKADGSNSAADQHDHGSPAAWKPGPTHLATPEPKHERPASPSPPLSPRHSVEKDAELAAQLAREEEPRRRSLRSASSSASVIPTLASRDSRPKASTARGRRNVKPSSPSRDVSPTTPVTPTTPTPLTSNGPTTRRQAQAHARDVEIATTRMTRRQTNRLGINGSVGGDHGAGLRASARLNGVGGTKTPSPAKASQNQNSRHASNTPSSARQKRGTRLSQRQPELAPSVAEDEGDVDAEGESDVDAEGEPYAEDTIVLEFVQPSNKTSSTPSVNGVKESPVEDSVMLHQHPSPGLPNGRHDPSDLSTGKSGQDPASSGNTSGDVVMNDEGDDIDAEGEPDDEDAEGEPDPDAYL